MDKRVKDWLRESIPGIGTIRPTRALMSAVTLEWKVRWSADMISRDLIQNFRDAAKGNLRQVKISAPQPGRVVVFGREEFNVERLYYIGSEKSSAAGDAGGFGEGFKAAAVALLRDFSTTPIVVSGSTGVVLTAAVEVVQGTDLKPLQYQFFEHDGQVSGTYLLLDGANRELTAAVKMGRDWFFDEKHPGVAGACLFENESVAVYPTRRSDGLAFYGGHLRMKLSGLPVIINCRRPIPKLDELISADRDRRMFEGKAADRFLTAVSQSLNGEGRRCVLATTKEKWRTGTGHPLLEAIAKKTTPTQVQTMYAAMGEDADTFFVEAADQPHYYYDRKPLEQLMQEWTAAGMVCLPRYFHRFGVKTAMDSVSEKQREREAEEAKKRRERDEQQARAAAQHRRELLEAQFAQPRSEEELRKGDCVRQFAGALLTSGFWRSALETIDVRIVDQRPYGTSAFSMSRGVGLLLIDRATMNWNFMNVATWVIVTVDECMQQYMYGQSIFRREAARPLLVGLFSHFALFEKLERVWSPPPPPTAKKRGSAPESADCP